MSTTDETSAGMVLIVEDNPLLRSLLKSMLDSLGVQGEVVGDGSAALLAVERQHYDLVLMDWELPEMSGADAAQAIRRGQPAGTRVPIVCMSGHALREHDAEWMAADMDGLLSKPFRITELRQVLARWLPALNTSA